MAERPDYKLQGLRFKIFARLSASHVPCGAVWSYDHENELDTAINIEYNYVNKIVGDCSSTRRQNKKEKKLHQDYRIKIFYKNDEFGKTIHR